MSGGVAASFARDLLRWFDAHGRKDLPWQREPTPYRVWVSEIMLQQTQVTTVAGYFDRFMARFPDIETLATAPLDAVLHLWSGLGYYARARNLHSAAAMIVANHGGRFPDTIAAVEALPGVGRSTAGAILSLSLDQRHPILDGNVKRVLTRWAGIEGFPGQRLVEQQLWQLADRLTPADRPAAYTQAIMDLGATVCTRTKPSCMHCPVAGSCVARAHGSQDRLPTPRPRTARVRREAIVVIALARSGQVLLERRPPVGIWGGLWGFPQFGRHADAEAWIGAELSIDPGTVEEGPAVLHAFTHFELLLRPWIVQLRAAPRFADAARFRWYDPRNPDEVGLAAPVAQLIGAAAGGQPRKVGKRVKPRKPEKSKTSQKREKTRNTSRRKAG